MRDYIINIVWVDDKYVYAQTKDGICAKYAFDSWGRLAKATPEQREDFHLTYFGIHWPQINEDLSFEGMFRDNGICDVINDSSSIHYEKDIDK